MTVQNPTKPTLELPARQRAMLAEMGVVVWLPAATAAPAVAAQSAAAPAQTALKPASEPKQKTTPAPASTPTPSAPPQSSAPTTPSVCPSCAPIAVDTLKNTALLPVDTARPRWLFVLDAHNQDANTAQNTTAQQLLRNIAAALRLHDAQTHQCHACSCFRLALNRTDTAPPTQCSAWLLHEIARIQPQVIVALGRQAAFSLLGSTAPLGSLRNTTHHIAMPQAQAADCPQWLQDIPVVVSYPLDYLLRTPAAKARAWQDVCLAHSVVHATPQ